MILIQRLLLIVTCLTIGLTSCNERKKSKDAWLTVSPIPDSSELPYYLVLDEGENIQIDTLQMIDSTLSLKFLPDTVGIAHLFNGKSEKICTFFAHESARISIRKQEKEWVCDGDSVNRLLFDFYQSVGSSYFAKKREITGIEQLIGKVSKDSIWRALSNDNRYKEDSILRAKTAQFMDQNRSLPTALIAMCHYHEQSVLTPADPLWLRTLTTPYLDSKCFDSELQQIKIGERLLPGATFSFSDFVSLDGKMYNESKIKRNKLVCFWDPNDTISVAGNKAFSRKLAANGSKDYAYISISLNGKRELVEQIKKNEKLYGEQLLTEGDNTSAKRREYGIVSSPYFVLLDTSNRVIKAGLYPYLFKDLFSKTKRSVPKK